MSVRDLIAAGVRRVREHHATSGLTYMAADGGTFGAVTGNFSMHHDRPDMLGYSEDAGGERLPMLAWLKGDDTGTYLAINGKVREVYSATVTLTWRILGRQTQLGKIMYRLKRDVPGPGNSSGPDRNDL